MTSRTRRRSARPSPSRSRRAKASRPASPRTTARARSRWRSTRAKGRYDLVHPGHVFPLRARAGGVLRRAGQTEAAVDLARLAGLNPGRRRLRDHARGRDDGPRARPRRVLPSGTSSSCVTVADLIEYRRRTEKLVERTTAVRLPTAYGEFRGRGVPRDAQRQAPRRARQGRGGGRRERARPRPLRVPHRRRLPLAALRLRRAARAGAARRSAPRSAACCSTCRRKGRGIGLLNKLQAYELQEEGLDTVEANLKLGFQADAREWGIGNQILAELGLTTIRILTNNPKKLTGLEGYGLTVVEQVPIEVPPNAENRRYLATKRDKPRPPAPPPGHALRATRRRSEPSRPETISRARLWPRRRRKAGEGGRFAGRVGRADGVPTPVTLRRPEHAAGELRVPDGYAVIEGEPSGRGVSVGIVVAGSTAR